MKFNDILKEITWRLVTEERISYRSIRNDFDLDDDGLEELRSFLEKKSVAIDEDGKFLVWAGTVVPAGAQRSKSSSTREVKQTRPEGVESAEETTATARDAKPLDAERRQLTVMFCDLVGSTDLANRLDPEDLADIIRAYHNAATTIVRRFDGYVAKYMGDGMLRVSQNTCTTGMPNDLSLALHPLSRGFHDSRMFCG